MLKPARLVNKAGDGNVEGINVPEKSAKFAKDIVHTLVSYSNYATKAKCLANFPFRLTHSGAGFCWFLFAHISYVGFCLLHYST